MTDMAARLERTIGVVLRLGVTISTICLAVGLVLSLVDAADVATPLLHVGVIVLLVTPVARVLVSVGEYAVARDWLFLALTLTVLLELLGSLAAAVYGRKL